LKLDGTGVGLYPVPSFGVSCVHPLYSAASVIGHFLLSSVLHQIILNLGLLHTNFAHRLLVSAVISTIYLPWEYHWNMCFCTVHVLNTYPTRSVVVNVGEGFAMYLPSIIAIYKYMKGLKTKGCILHRKRTWQKTHVEKNNR
jgi:hypothetical protein